MKTDENTLNKVLYDSDEAAKYRTGFTGWISRHGRFFSGVGAENAARYDGCTHRPCSICKMEAERLYSVCVKCRGKIKQRLFDALPARVWDGKEPLTIFRGDEYFFDEDELIAYCEDAYMLPQDINLVFCRPVYGREISSDDFIDELPEDGELPKVILDAIEHLNRITKSYGPLSWREGNVRAIIKDVVE